MTKVISNFSKASLSFLLGMSLVIPLGVFAQDVTTSTQGTLPPVETRNKDVRIKTRLQDKVETGDDKGGLRDRAIKKAEDAKGTSKGDGNICARIDQMSEKILSEISEKETKLSEKKDANKEKRDDRKEEKQTNLQEVRDKWEANRNEHYDKLLERATTDAQKQAVEAFKTALQSAIKTRQTAIDQAQATYKAGVEKLMQDQNSLSEIARKTLKTQMTDAINKAKEDCKANVDGATIKTKLQNALKAAQDTFKNRAKGTVKSDALKVLVDARNQAIKKAQDEFKIARDKAVQALKAAFPKVVEPVKKTETTSTTPAQ